MLTPIRIPRVATLLMAAALAVMLLPGLAAAHSELVTSDPAQGAVVQQPHSGPIVLTFSEHLASGSMADLVDSAGTTVSKAVVDANAKTMTFTLTTPLAQGAWQVRWVSIADDGDLLRDIVSFTVATPASTSPTASPVASAAPSASAADTSAAPSAGTSPSPSGAGSTTGGANGDVILPIVVALIILGAGAAYLLTRRNRPPDAT
jgi:methionine-rich copper-binding protein CopC